MAARTSVRYGHRERYLVGFIHRQEAKGGAKLEDFDALTEVGIASYAAARVLDQVIAKGLVTVDRSNDRYVLTNKGRHLASEAATLGVMDQYKAGVYKAATVRQAGRVGAPAATQPEEPAAPPAEPRTTPLVDLSRPANGSSPHAVSFSAEGTEALLRVIQAALQVGSEETASDVALLIRELASR